MIEQPTILQRLRRFAARPTADKIQTLKLRLRRIFPKAPVPRQLPLGIWFLVGESHVDAALLNDTFESAEINFVQRYLKPGMIALDIGAHHGLYTLLASKRVGARGKVVAFEPSPRERKQLSRNVRLNACSNVRIQPFALGSKRSRTDLHLVEGGEDGCNSLRPPVVNSQTRPVSVDVYRFDDVAPKLRLTGVDFVKLDVEGAELDVLNGAPELLKAIPRPVLLVEVYDIRTEPWGYKAREIVQFLYHCGYEWFQLRQDGTLISVLADLDLYDSNLVAIPKERVVEVLRSMEPEVPNV
jgi:FkbM family methyltransferase